MTSDERGELVNRAMHATTRFDMGTSEFSETVEKVTAVIREAYDLGIAQGLATALARADELLNEADPDAPDHA